MNVDKRILKLPPYLNRVYMSSRFRFTKNGALELDNQLY